MNNRKISKHKVSSSSVSSFIFKAVCLIFMTVMALTFLYVIIWMVFSSFRDRIAYHKNPLNIFDFKSFTLNSYKTVFSYKYDDNISYFNMLLNSLIHISIGVIIGLIFEPLIGYVMAKFKFKVLNSILMFLIIITMTIPNIGTVFYTVKLMNYTLNLKNRWLNLIIQLAGGINFSAIIYMNYFKNIPTDYAESAYLDGANELKTYLNIYFVLCAPLLIATSVLRIIAFWNDYYSIFLYMPDRPTVAYGIWYMQADFELEKQYTASFSALTITSTISILLYAVFSNKIMSSLSVGGVKA